MSCEILGNANPDLKPAILWAYSYYNVLKLTRGVEVRTIENDQTFLQKMCEASQLKNHF
jgi:hypothetical protein